MRWPSQVREAAKLALEDGLEPKMLRQQLYATMATMASELVGNQCRPDLLDAPITIILIFIDSAAPATQNGVSKMSTVL